MIVLVDMDGVLANYEGLFLKRWREKYPDFPYIPREQRNTFRLSLQYPKKYKKQVQEIYRSPGFFIDLEPIEGSIEAVQDISNKGNTVFFCSSPLSYYHHCVQEKYQWIDKHFGRGWVDKIILTKDKTLVKGDILIDDRPEIRGASNPSWEHVLYEQPYNRHITDRKKITWETYQQVLCI